MKAIETVYKGYRFRSRLEARWAVFFDALGVSWEYEPEGFETTAGWYLPDFRIDVVTDPQKKFWVEIKPAGVFCCDKFEAFKAGLPHSRGCAQVYSGDPVQFLAALFGLTHDEPIELPSGQWCSAFYVRDCCLFARQVRFEHGEAPKQLDTPVVSF